MKEHAPPLRSHDITELASVPLETMADVGVVKSQLETAVFDFISFQVHHAIDSEAPQPATESLQEKYDLKFDPEKTIKSLGGTATLLSSPDGVEAYLKKQGLDKAELTR